MSARSQTEFSCVAVFRRIGGKFVQHHLQVIANVGSPYNPNPGIGKEVVGELAYIFIRAVVESQYSLMPDDVSLLQ